MKKILLLAFLFLSVSIVAQKYYTKTGKTQFKASVEAFEPVEATNNSTTAIINTASGEIASLLFVKAFNFRVALMQEHFNENYMESTTYPKATFNGKIESISSIDFSKDGTYSSKVNGKLTIKNVTQDVATIGTFVVTNGVVNAKATFNLNPYDYNVKIPKMVAPKISESIKITINSDYTHTH